MIALKEISKKYRTDLIETTALADIDVQIGTGEFVAVMGPSGCGKSTLLNIMGLIDSPTNGQIAIAGEDVARMTGKALARFRNQKLGFIFQSFHLIPELSVLDNVIMPLIYRTMPNSMRRMQAAEALEAVGLSHRMQHYPNQLSGGQKQRVAIARAIAGQPAIILADEPTGNLDSVMGHEIMQILLQLNETQKTTIVMVTHDEVMARKTHRLIRLYDGRLV